MGKKSSEQENTALQIWLKHLITPFNAFNFAIGIGIAAVGAYENLLYLVVIVLNIMIGAIQELRAKSVVDSLALLNTSKAQVLRDGTVFPVDVSDVQTGDLVLFLAGDQIYAECRVTEGHVEVNEALLTGESEPIIKLPGDQLLSGSYIISGTCKAVAEKTGEDCYAQKLTRQAKTHKKYHSGIMDMLNRLVRFTSYFIIPLGLLLFYHSYFRNGDSLQTAVVTTSAALLGLLPKGLVLLTSVSLAIGIIKLGNKKLLVQEFYGIEALARTDVLCMDKTGTLTTGNLIVTDVIPLNNTPEARIQKLGSLLSGAFETKNSTFLALRNFYTSGDTRPDGVVEFSPTRGWSAAYFAGEGTVFLGEWEKLFRQDHPEEVVRAMEDGKRVVVIGISDQPLGIELPDQIQPVAALCIQDTLRKDTKKVLQYFKEQGVTLKILSGDHPRTVAAIARAAGIGADVGCIDMTDLQDDALFDAVDRYDIFGRVNPEQKQKIIRLLQQRGHKVAMLGDGVNDVMALKLADCGIAISTGCDAARKVARMVLFGDGLEALPKVIAEGRRVVNNISVTSSLFLTKTCFSFMLSLVFVLLGRAYPLIPLQLSIYGIVFEAVPAFILTFRENNVPLPEKILRSAIKRALPFAAAITFFTTIIQVVGTARGYAAAYLSWVSFGAACVCGAVLVVAVWSSRRSSIRRMTGLSKTDAVGWVLSQFK